MARFDAATGRYVYLTIDGVEYRVYFEEAGAGIPLLLQHTAGADGRQWRHLLEDADVGRHFRMIAYDLPYHAKSVPPVAVEWWAEEYRLTRDFFMQVPVTLAADLACYHPGVFRATISPEGSLCTPAMGRALAAAVRGATFHAMPGLGHFPMCENPARFREHILPVLDEIRARHSD